MEEFIESKEQDQDSMGWKEPRHATAVAKIYVLLPLFPCQAKGFVLNKNLGGWAAMAVHLMAPIRCLAATVGAFSFLLRLLSRVTGPPLWQSCISKQYAPGWSGPGGAPGG